MNQAIFDSAISQIKGNIWLEGLFGIEKENIRVDESGSLSLTPHPKAFGNKRKHPFITTDFSESQIEMITPPQPDIKQAIGFLETLHDIISLGLENEYLWPQSIPPVLPDDEKIPIARYDNDGKDAEEYRKFLAEKYGAKNQLFSGIHFNLSFSDRLLELIYRHVNPEISFSEFRDEAYLKATRQLLRLRWIFVLLYGSSPVVDSTMELKCKKAPYSPGKQVIGLSIRNSCFGYQNIGDIYPDYGSVKNYHESISRFVQNGKISSPKELYTSVRPKFLNGSDHISYLEVRFIDIDPLIKSGISMEALTLVHSLALYGLLSEEPDNFDAGAQQMANNYHGYVSLYGLNRIVMSNPGEKLPVWSSAKNHLLAITGLFKQLDISDPDYLRGLERAGELVENPEKRGVNTVLNGVLKSGYIPYHMERARMYLNESRNKQYNFQGYEDMELSTQLVLREGIRRGVGFEILDRKENFVRFSKNGNTQYVKQATKTSLDNYASILAMENKLVTKIILHDAGIKVPSGYSYTNLPAAKSAFPLFAGKPVVIKPNQTNFGIGITILKENNDVTVFQRAVDIAFEYDTTVLIEEFIEGKEFRIFVIKDEVVGILHRVPANVTGDGKLTIRDLVYIKNQDPLRGKGYRTPLEKIQLGEAEEMFLKAQNRTFDTIPGEGETVYLRENSNISTGGDSIDVTDDIPASYKEIAVKAASALNVNITGLDMIIRDPGKKDPADNYAIIELNFNPAIHIHCHPYKGKNRRLDAKLMDALGYTTE